MDEILEALRNYDDDAVALFELMTDESSYTLSDEEMRLELEMSKPRFLKLTGDEEFMAMVNDFSDMATANSMYKVKRALLRNAMSPDGVRDRKMFLEMYGDLETDNSRPQIVNNITIPDKDDSL